MKIHKILTLSLILITCSTFLQGGNNYQPSLATIGDDDDREIDSFSGSDETDSTFEEEDYDTCDTDSDDSKENQTLSYDLFPAFAPLTNHPTHQIENDVREKLDPILELNDLDENDPEESVIPLGRGY